MKHPFSKSIAVTALVLLALPAAAGEHGAPPTLRAVMQDLGKVHVALVDALLKGDLAAVAGKAEAIANHPLPKPIVGAIKAELGGEFEAFRQIDMATHQAAEATARAARDGDQNAAAREAAQLTEDCVACHTGFRERLRPLSD